MRRAGLVTISLMVLLAAMLLVSTSCRSKGPPQPWLPDYYGHIQTMHMMSLVPAKPFVQIGDGSVPTRAPSTGLGAIRAGTQLVGSVRGSQIAGDLEDRLYELVPSQRLADNLATALGEAIPARMPITPVWDLREEHDTRLEVEVSAYGINARNTSAPAYYVLRADSRIIYVPEGRVIWSAVTNVNERVTPEHPQLGGTIGQLAGTSVNLSALQQLEDEDLQRVFDALIVDAAVSIADQIRRDSVR